jgi:hypothetical protein
MLTQIRRFLATPVFEDEDKKRAASLLNIISLALLGVTVVSTIFILLEEGFNIPDLAIGIAASLLEVGVQFLMRRDHVKLASLIQSSILWIMLTAMTVFFGGVRAATFSSYVLIILMTGLLLGSYAGIVAAGLSVAAGLVMLYLESQNILISFPGVDPVSALVTQSSHFILSAIMVHATVRSLRNALERARNSNRELQTVQASLEQRMAAHQEQRDHLQTTVEEYTDYLVEVELGNLAEQSRQATAQVRDILLDIQSGINATVMATEEGGQGGGRGRAVGIRGWGRHRGVIERDRPIGAGGDADGGGRAAAGVGGRADRTGDAEHQPGHAAEPGQHPAGGEGRPGPERPGAPTGRDRGAISIVATQERTHVEKDSKTDHPAVFRRRRR